MLASLVEFEPDVQANIKRETGMRLRCITENDPLLQCVDILIAPGYVQKETLERCTSLKWLHCIHAGLDRLPLANLAAKHVRVTGSSGIHGQQMSEHALGMMIAFSRRFPELFRNQMEGRFRPPDTIGELTGKTLCIIGAGSIGRAVAEKAAVFGLRVIGIKKHPVPLPGFDEVWAPGRLDDALAAGDYVLLLTPLTDETHHLIGRRELERMKPGGILINFSRGEVVDEDALIEALRSGRIAGAGLDVFQQEPLPQASPLWKLPNVILSPHCAGYSPYYLRRAADRFLSLWREETLSI